jgi:hypothetical protein
VKLTIRKQAPSVTAFILTSRSRGTIKKNIPAYLENTKSSLFQVLQYDDMNVLTVK